MSNPRTVIRQDEKIQALSRLLAGAEEAATERAAQIERVREAVSRIEKKLENGTTEWRDGLKADQHLEGYTDGLDIALAEIEHALGGNDD